MNSPLTQLPVEVRFAEFYNNQIKPEIEKFISDFHSNSQSIYVTLIKDSWGIPYIILKCATDPAKNIGIRIEYDISKESILITSGLSRNYENGLFESEFHLFQGPTTTFNPQHIKILLDKACKYFNLDLF